MSMLSAYISDNLVTTGIVSNLKPEYLSKQNLVSITKF